MESKIGVGDNVSVKLMKGHAAKVAVCSDLHLEFGMIELKNRGDVDLLILAGDVCVAKDLNDYDSLNLVGENTRSQQWHKFFQNASEEFPHVLYIMGNHEHYHGDFATTVSHMRKKLAYLKNVHILDNETFDLNGIRFIGATLWTDMNKEDPLTLYQMRSYMNDFRCVTNSNSKVTFRIKVAKDKPVGMTDEKWLALPEDERVTYQFNERTAKFSPEDSLEEHKKTLAFIHKVYEETPPWINLVFIGHHTPSFKSCDPVYLSDTVSNGAYHSSLEDFILDHQRIKLWIHGHTHDRYDYMIGDTRIFANPRGYYRHESIANSFTLKILEI